VKILYLNFDQGIPVLGDKGASVHVREFVRAAAALGHEVLLVCARLGSGNEAPPVSIAPLPPQRTDEPEGGQARQPGAKTDAGYAALIDAEHAKIAYDRALPARLERLLQARQFVPDFIYERHALFGSAGARIAAALGCPRILEVNAPLVEEHKRFRGLRLESIARRMECAAFASASAIVAVSSAVKQYIAARVPERASAIHVLPNGVDLRRFAAGEQDRAPLRARLGVGAQTGVIGFVGSFKAWHGTELLLEAYRSVCDTHDVHLLAVGDGPRWETFCNTVASAPWRNSVSALGRVPHVEIPGWTAACDVVVAPYQAAADFYFSPLKVIEALAGGRPVVAPRIGQLTELIDDGESGLLYHPDDALDCARAIITLLDDPQRRALMGRTAQQRMAGRGWERIVTCVARLADAARVGAAA
jgi:glycosyltransferase involved in cell wall biosynthesis